MTTEIQTQSSHDSFIKLAIENKAPMEDLKMLLEMKREHESDEARKVFNMAMSRVHKKIPNVSKTLKNNQTNSLYTSLDEIINKVKPIYTDEGFAVNFFEGDSKKESEVRLCAKVRHEQGHVEEYHYDIPLDGTGIKGNRNMTSIHGKASSMTYGRRYLMCMIFNIPTGDDNDGNGVSQYLTDEQATFIDKLVRETKTKPESVLKFSEGSTYNEIPQSKYQALVASLNKKKADVNQKASA